MNVPLFKDSSEGCSAPINAVADWLASNIYDETYYEGKSFAKDLLAVIQTSVFTIASVDPSASVTLSKPARLYEMLIPLTASNSKKIGAGSFEASVHSFYCVPTESEIKLLTNTLQIRWLALL